MSSYLTLSPLPRSGRFPFCGTFHIPGLGTVAVSNHPALWSSDFPLLLNHRSSDHPACSGLSYCTRKHVCIQAFKKWRLLTSRQIQTPGKGALRANQGFSLTIVDEDAASVVCCPWSVAKRDDLRTHKDPGWNLGHLRPKVEIGPALATADEPLTTDICRLHGHLILNMLGCRSRSIASVSEDRLPTDDGEVPRE